MTKNNFKSVLMAFFASIVIVSAPFNLAKAEQQIGLTEEQKASVIKQIEKQLNSLESLSFTYQNRLQSFKSKSYTYQYSEGEARRRALLVYPDGSSSQYEDQYKFELGKNFKQKYSSFIGTFNGGATSELGYTAIERQTAQINRISLDGGDFGDTDLQWDKVISQATKQAAIERQPANGAGAAIKSANELDDIKTDLINQHGKVKALLAALVPSNTISVNCSVAVDAEGKCPEGKEVYTVTTPDGKATTGASRGCVPLPVKYAEIQTCILCPLFEVILRTDQTMATKSYGALSGSFRNLVIVVLALFIAYQTLLTVSAFTKQDAPKYISSLLMQGFKVLVAALLLSDSTYIYQYVINPLMKAGLEFGLALLFKPDLIQEYGVMTNQYLPGMPSGVIGQDLLASVMAAVKMFSKAAAQMPAIGSSLICIATHEASWKDILPNFSMFIEGLLVYAFGWAIALSCCFYLLDSVVRFGIFCALLPFLIASWPFKVTAKYTKTGWDIFMNSFFNFVMMGLIISINAELIASALSGGKGGLDELESAINGSNVKILEDLMDISGVQFLVLVACCMFAFKLVGQVNALASQISSTSGGTDIGGKIGGAAAQVVNRGKNLAVSGGKAVGGAIYEGSGAKASVDGVKERAMGRLAKAGAAIGLGRQTNPNGAGSGNSRGESSPGIPGGNQNSGGNPSGESGSENPSGGSNSSGENSSGESGGSNPDSTPNSNRGNNGNPNNQGGRRS